MKKLIRVVLVLMVLLAPSSVLAGIDYITEAVKAIELSRVYVAPVTEGTDSFTAGKLQARLRADDNIVLVMLPAAAEKELGMTISEIANRLSERLENKRIIGLSVGRKVVGLAPGLPVGVAADQMRRAESVSNDSVTALATFIQNVHIWQAEQQRLNPTPTPRPTPKPIATPAPESSQENGLPWYLILVGLVGFAIAVSVGNLITRGTTDQTGINRTRFKAPDQVKDLLAKIVKERDRVNDRELKDALYQMCVDIEKYFSSSSKEKERDALFFKDRLTEVTKVLAKYIEVQQSPRYFYEPEKELSRGKESIVDFSQYVLDSIRRGHAADLLDYTVNTKILQAQRYR